MNLYKLYGAAVEIFVELWNRNLREKKALGFMKHLGLPCSRELESLFYSVNIPQLK